MKKHLSSRTVAFRDSGKTTDDLLRDKAHERSTVALEWTSSSHRYAAYFAPKVRSLWWRLEAAGWNFLALVSVERFEAVDHKPQALPSESPRAVSTPVNQRENWA